MIGTKRTKKGEEKSKQQIQVQNTSNNLRGCRILTEAENKDQMDSIACFS